jgi:hypothetical protein
VQRATYLTCDETKNVLEAISAGAAGVLAGELKESEIIKSKGEGIDD